LTRRSLLTATSVLPIMARAQSTATSILGPYSASTNFACDLLGVPDTRPGTWGLCGVADNIVQFHPPPGYRVRILRVYGDFSAYPRAVVPAGKYAGISWGLITPSARDKPSTHADNAGTAIVWRQAFVGQNAVMSDFDYDTSIGGLLDPDNKLISRMAIWLNETGVTMHMEPTWVMEFQYER
jgi:hypothetical protein